MKIGIILSQIKNIIEKHLPERPRIILFGSWAQGKALDSSDLDIGILDKGKIPFAIITKIKQDIEAIETLRSIDLVDLNTVDKTFREKALKESKNL